MNHRAKYTVEKRANSDTILVVLRTTDGEIREERP
jgi:hypothetical protein